MKRPPGNRKQGKEWRIILHPNSHDARIYPLSHRARYVILVLESYARMNAFCYVGNEDLIAVTGMCIRSIQEALDELEDAGWIVRIFTAGKKPVRIGFIMRHRVGPKTPFADTPETLAKAQIALCLACGNPHAKTEASMRKSARAVCDIPHAPACGNPHRNKDVVVKKEENKKEGSKTGNFASPLNDNDGKYGVESKRDGDRQKEAPVEIGPPPRKPSSPAPSELHYHRAAPPSSGVSKLADALGETAGFPQGYREIEAWVIAVKAGIEPAGEKVEDPSQGPPSEPTPPRRSVARTGGPESPLAAHGYASTGDPDKDRRVAGYLDEGGVLADQAKKNLDANADVYAKNLKAFNERVSPERLKDEVAEIMRERKAGNPATLDFLAGLGPGCDKGQVEGGVARMCRELDDEKSRGWYHLLFAAVTSGEISPEVLVHAYAHAMSPSCPNRGRWFIADVRRCGHEPMAKYQPRPRSSSRR